MLKTIEIGRLSKFVKLCTFRPLVPFKHLCSIALRNMFLAALILVHEILFDITYLRPLAITYFCKKSIIDVW